MCSLTAKRSVTHIIPHMLKIRPVLFFLAFTISATMVVGVCLAQDPLLVDSLEHELSMAEKSDDKQYWLNRLTYIHIANNPNKAAEYNIQARQIALSERDEKGYMRTVHYEGLINRFLGKYSDAIENFKTALTYFEKEGIEKSISGALFNLGVTYGLMGDYEKSLEYLFRQMAFDEALGDTANVADALNSIGSIYRKQGKYEEAVKKYKESIKIYTILRKKEGIAMLNSNLANLYYERGITDSAIYYAETALRLNRETHSSHGMGYDLHIIGASFSSRNELDSAVIYLEEALAIRHELNQKLELGETMLALGAVWHKQGRKDEGIALVLDALGIADSIGAFEFQTTAHRSLADLYKSNGSYNRALYHLEQYAALKDTVLTKEKLRVTSDLEARYQSAKKDARIAENALEIEAADNRVQKQRWLIQLGIAGLVALLIVIVLLIWIFNERRKRSDEKLANLRKEKELIALKSIMMGEEKERSRIARDLHDGLSSLLAAIKIKFNSLQQTAPELQSSEKFNAALGSLDEASGEVRRIAHNMMPEILLKYGLVEALSEFITNLNVSGSRKIEFNSFGFDERLSSTAELAIYRVIQELLNNIVRHSGATEVLVQLMRRDKELTVTVEDNGVGFDATGLNETKGMGLGNLESRVDYLNGELNIQSLPEKGTSVYIAINLDKIPPDS